MVKKIPCLIDKKININGRNIYCKVTGIDVNDDKPYVLVIPGGPGCRMDLPETYLQPLLQIANQRGKSIKDLPHFIFFDPLGCGKSDKALHPEEEYTVDHFTDLDAALVEAVKNELNLKQMNLYVEGESFGSEVAMNFPARKPQWLENSSPIKLKQIISLVGPDGADLAPYAFQYLSDHYKDHPDYKVMQKAQNKLFTGTFKDKSDYIKNFLVPMGPLYAKDIKKSLINKLMFNIVSTFPRTVAFGIHILNGGLKKLGIYNEDLELFDSSLNGFSFTVANHFFKRNFGGYHLIETIEKHPDIYKKLPICLISAEEDHMVDVKITKEINRKLPGNSAAIILKNSHILNNGEAKDVFNKLYFSLLIDGEIKTDDLNNSLISSHTVTPDYLNKLKLAHRKFTKPFGGSTLKMSTYMPEIPNKAQGKEQPQSLPPTSLTVKSSLAPTVILEQPTQTVSPVFSRR